MLTTSLYLCHFLLGSHCLIFILRISHYCIIQCGGFFFKFNICWTCQLTLKIAIGKWEGNSKCDFCQWVTRMAVCCLRCAARPRPLSASPSLPSLHSVRTLRRTFNPLLYIRNAALSFCPRGFGTVWWITFNALTRPCLPKSIVKILYLL